MMVDINSMSNSGILAMAVMRLLSQAEPRMATVRALRHMLAAMREIGGLEPDPATSPEMRDFEEHSVKMWLSVSEMIGGIRDDASADEISSVFQMGIRAFAGTLRLNQQAISKALQQMSTVSGDQVDRLIDHMAGHRGS